MEQNTFRLKLQEGFQNLKDRGYFVSEENLRGEGFWCCMGCGLSAIPYFTTHYAFYHQQDADRLNRGERAVYLVWGGDGYTIRKVFLEVGLAVEWDGNSVTRIGVHSPALH
jgi:hypothetical protein